ncbi:MAG: SHOCT domain-containing protein [Candidatus Bathyarchaeota archaeon]|nr:SHOCT domain-containing protein [Candidatus Bathyarchaeota archaeon]
MKLKAVSGIMLILLLIGMLILTFNIQPVKASGSIDPIRSIAFISLLIGPVFAVLGFWNMVKQKQTDLVTRLEELKEQLGRGVITQEEYEHLLFTLSNLSTAIITEEEYEQKKKNLLEKSET